MTTEKWHEKNHGSRVTSDQCWRCQRGRALCRSKVYQFQTAEEARATVEEMNLKRGYLGRLTVEYFCRWCEKWHMTTARGGRLRKARKRYRKAKLKEADE